MLHKLFLVCLFIIAFTFPALAEAEVTSEICGECHGEVDDDAPLVTWEMVNQSVHGELECLNCHDDITEIPHSGEKSHVYCGRCHEEEVSTYKRHGVFEVESNPDIPGCADCHGTHEILGATVEQSKTHPLNLPQTCGNCHEESKITKNYKFLPKHPIETYKSSVHGKATADGKYGAATCNDCHSTDGSAHMIYSPGNPDSTINHFAIPATCGRCHEEIAKKYNEGIHGQLAARGETDSPVCTNCHGEHRILSHLDERSQVHPTKLAEATCAPCHESAALTEKYGLPAGRLASFIDSYHGLKSKAGDITVANCASCHGAHRILPQSDESSSIHASNLQVTCGECHPDISKALATTRIHDDGGQHQRGWTLFFAVLYMVIITVTVAGMSIYIFLEIYKAIRKMTKVEQVRRMSGLDILQHTLLVLSFFTLVITGFALRFYDSWWVDWMFGHEGGFHLRNLIHRIAAGLFIFTIIFHLIHLRSKDGKAFIRGMIPNLSDLKHLIQTLKYNLGLSQEQAKFGKFSFGEKFEYWALVWGSGVMVLTGLMLWFDNFFVQYFPKGFLDVMLIIHYYEAWLATLAVLIWHLYSVIFKPGVYPMNPSWITGKMPKSQYEHEHAGDVDKK